jgi:hypothetical protein
LEKDLHIILGDYRRLWMQRNRIGGLKDSLSRLENLLPSKVSK